MLGDLSGGWQGGEPDSEDFTEAAAAPDGAYHPGLQGGGATRPSVRGIVSDFHAIRKIDTVHVKSGAIRGMTTKILIVDDDAELCDAFVEHLALHVEFESIVVETGAKGVQAAKAGQIDLIIMDVGLPDVDGREAVRILRKNGFKAPIIMLTGHDTDSDIILGLESGANDYVAKPFRFAVMLARIRAQLRQHEASEDAVFNVGPYTFRPGSKLLLNSNGKKVWLTVKETAILKHLYRAGQQPVSREVLLQEVWAYNSGVTTHTLETHIYRLRQKVENDPANPAILVTESGGYKLVP
jgi:DNA-binding response OmpR family regulator